MKKAIAGLMFGIIFLTGCNKGKIAFAQGFVRGWELGSITEESTAESIEENGRSIVKVLKDNPYYLKKLLGEYVLQSNKNMRDIADLVKKV